MYINLTIGIIPFLISFAIIIALNMIDCQVKCNKINEKIYKALRGEYENQGVYGDDY